MKKSRFVIVFAVAVMCVGAGLWYTRSEDQTVPTTPAAEAGVVQPVRIVAIGDMVCDPNDPKANGQDSAVCQSAKVKAITAGLKPHMVLGLGDLQYQKGELANFQKGFDKEWGAMRNILYPTPGNHEYETAGAKGYFDYFAAKPPKDITADEIRRGYYSLDVGGWHIVSLNSTCEQIGGCDTQSPQLKWLKEDLRQNSKACTLAFWHYPRFSSGRNNLAHSAPFWEALYAAKADVVLSSHDHLYERFGLQSPDGKADPAGLRQFTIGTGGRSLHPKQQIAANSQKVIDDMFGIFKLDISEGSYAWEFIGIDGKTLDSGSSECQI